MHQLIIEFIAALAAWATTAYQSEPLGRNSLSGLCLQDMSVQLAQKLSNTAKIYLQGSNEFTEASARWSTLDAPTANVIVVPGTQNDVVETVRFMLNCGKVP